MSHLLTRNRGELVFRLGSHPPKDALYNGTTLDVTEGRRGKDLTRAEVDRAGERLKDVVEDLGGEVRKRHLHFSFLLMNHIPS